MKTLSKILLAASCLLPASAAAAPTVKSFAIHNGNNAGLLWNNGPRNNDQRGTGLEHMSSHILAAADGGPVVLTIGSGSYTDIPNSPIPQGTRLQALCTSWKLDETAGLVKGTMKYITNNRGNEYQNAMVPGAIPIMGGKYLLVTYGVDLNGNTETYAKVLGPNCEEMSAQTRILAKNNDNPVYYVQYAHARICSVLRAWQEAGGGDVASLKEVDLSPLDGPQAQALMLQLAKYPDMLTAAAEGEAPHDVAFYLRDLAASYHSYYDAERILVDDEAVKRARLALVGATAQVLHNGLAVLGVSAPARM